LRIIFCKLKTRRGYQKNSGTHFQFYTFDFARVLIKLREYYCHRMVQGKLKKDSKREDELKIEIETQRKSLSEIKLKLQVRKTVIHNSLGSETVISVPCP